MASKKAKISKPSDISSSGWKNILIKAKKDLGEKNLSIVSAGVAFYIFLAVFPALIAFISIYGLVLDPQQIQQQISSLSGMMPQNAFEILQQQIEDFISTSSATLSWGIGLSILLSLWSANKGTKSLFKGVNIAYNTSETRSFFKLNGLTLLFTLAAMILVIITMSLIVVFPAIKDLLGLPGYLDTLIRWTRWLLLAVIIVFSISVLYKVAPYKYRTSFKWVKPGAYIATVLWLIASWAFSFYVSNFGNYPEVYGSVSAVIVFLLWLYLSCFIIVLGAEVNSDMEAYAGEKYS